METFSAVLKCEPSALLNIGGGEPTCHPLFWDFMAIALRKRGPRIWLATNGKNTEHALVLGEMVRKGEIRAVLSQDKWHEPISPLVVEFWKQTRDRHDKPVIRNVGKNDILPISQGRCDWGLDVCNGHGGPWIMWDGTVKQCGCLDAPSVGDVFNGYKAGNGIWNCWKNKMHPDRRKTCKDVHVKQTRMEPISLSR